MGPGDVAGVASGGWRVKAKCWFGIRHKWVEVAPTAWDWKISIGGMQTTSERCEKCGTHRVVVELEGA